MQEENRTLKKPYKTLEKKAILRERENVRLGKLLEQKDRDLEQKNKDLNLERSLEQQKSRLGFRCRQGSAQDRGV